jgi:hypothetical protein
MFCGNLTGVFFLINMAAVPLSSPKRDEYFVFATIYSCLIIQTDNFSVHLEVPLSHNYKTASPAVNGTEYAPNIH